MGDDQSVKTAKKFFVFFSSLSVSSGLWCTRCPLSCQLLTSLVWSSRWRLTPTFMTSMLEKDKACVSWKLHSTTTKSAITILVQRLTLCAVTGNHGAVVHWSRWRSLIILVVATVLTSACADLVTENIQPILNQPNVSQVSRGFWACSPGFDLALAVLELR